MRRLTLAIFLFAVSASAPRVARANYDFAHVPVHSQDAQKKQQQKPFFEKRRDEENDLPPSMTWMQSRGGGGHGNNNSFFGGHTEPFFKSSYSAGYASRIKIVELGGDHQLHVDHPQSTPYGQTHVEHLHGELTHKVVIARETYRVSKRADGMLVYTDPHGKAHEGVIHEGGGLRTPDGVTSLLETSDGPRQILTTHFNGNMPSQYRSVRIEGGRLHYEPIFSHKTPLGDTEIVISGGKLIQRLTLPGHTVTVAKKADGTFVYTDEHGKAHEGVIHLGGHVLTPNGLTTSLHLPDGAKHEVLVTEQKAGSVVMKQYRVVTEEKGELRYKLVQGFSTEYGNTHVVVGSERLDHVITVEGKPYVVTRKADGTLVLTDEQGHAQEGFLRHGDALYTRHGLTQRVTTSDGKPLDVVRDRSNGFTFGNESRMYVVHVERGALQYESIPVLETIYGRASITLDNHRLGRAITVRGKTYVIEQRGEHLRYTDAHGKHSDDAIVLADGIETPKGFAKTLSTPIGPLHVLATPAKWGGGTDYVSVTLKDGELHEEKLATIDTMYGKSKLSIGDTSLSNHVEIDGHKFEVTHKDKELVFTDEHGKAHHGRIQFANGVKTQHGQSMSVMTADGPRDVVTMQDGSRAYVHWKNGAMEFTRISTIGTSYGNAEPVFNAGRLAWQLKIYDHPFEVVQHDNTLVYVDAHGTKHNGIVRIGKHLALPMGLTSTMIVDGVEHEVLVSGGSYSLVSSDGSKVTPIETVATLHGPAKVVHVGNEIKHEIQLEGRPFYVVSRNGARAIVDAHGAPYVDTYVARATGKTLAPVTVRRRFVAGLPAISDGTIATIGGHAHMAKLTYDQLRDAMIETMQKFDPKTHYFIGLGSDPHPIICFLENVGGKGLATNFPASGKYHNGLDAKILDPYVRKLIPAEVLNGSKTLVLLDQTTSGGGTAGTLSQITPVFEQYLKMIGAPAKVMKLAYSPNMHPSDTAVVDTKKYPEVGKFLGSPYEHIVSQYPRHVLNVNTLAELVEQPNYQLFKDAMLERMKRDEKLDAFLVGVGASSH